VITLAHLASVASLWTALQGTFGAAATTRGGARSGGGGNASYDVDVIPGAGLGLIEGHLNLSLGYGPMFNFRNLGSSDAGTVVLHSGYLRVGYSERAFTLAISESASVGTMAFRGLRTVPVDPKAVPNPTMSGVDLVPANDVQRVFNESTGASMSYRWNPRISSGLSSSYSIGGGWGDQAQVSLPQIRTAGGEVSTSYLLTTADTTGLSVGLSNIRTHGGTEGTDATGQPILSPDYRYWSLSANLHWTHRWSRATSTSLAGGAYGYSTVREGHTRLYSLSLNGGGSFDTQLLREGRMVVSAGLGAGVGPSVNTLTGAIQQRAQGTGRLTATMQEFSVNASVDGSQSFPIDDPQAARLIGAGVGAGYAVSKFMDLALDYRSTFQSSNVSSVSHLWTVFLTLSVRAPPVRF
jgi:hypothetical protein